MTEVASSEVAGREVTKVMGQFNSNMRVRIMPFLQKKGNRVAKAAVEFDDFCGAGACLFAGFTICDDAEKGLFIMFPAANTNSPSGERHTFFMLRPASENFLQKLQDAILDQYEAMTAFNRPALRARVAAQSGADS